MKDDYSQGSLPDPWAGLNCLWRRFAPLADEGFLRDYPTHPHQRFWEMILACVLMDAGFHLGRTPDRLGPDLVLSLSAGRPVWVEATALDAGSGRKAVPPLQSENRVSRGQAIMSRYIHALGEKRQQWNRWLEAQIVAEGDPFILALNGWASSGGEERFPPYIVRSVLFACSSIAGFLSTAGRGMILPMNEFIFVHNPCAQSPLPHGWLTGMREVWVEQDRIEWLVFSSQRGCGRTPLVSDGGMGQ